MSRSDGLQRLRSMAGHAPFLSAQQEAVLVSEVVKGSSRALDQLLRAHLRLVL